MSKKPMTLMEYAEAFKRVHFVGPNDPIPKPPPPFSFQRKIHEEDFHLEGDYRCACKRCLNQFKSSKIITRIVQGGGLMSPVTGASEPSLVTVDFYTVRVCYELKTFQYGRKVLAVYHPRDNDDRPMMLWKSTPYIRLPAEMVSW